MITFSEYLTLHEAFDSITPKPIPFGSNEDWDDPTPYTNQKFSAILGLMRTVFVLDGIYFQVLCDKTTQEVSFRVSRTEDLTQYSDEPIGVSINIQILFSHILYIISKYIEQYKPPRIMFTSRSHTKKLYAGFYKSKALNDQAKKLGYSLTSSESLPDGSDKYVYSKVV